MRTTSEPLQTFRPHKWKEISPERIQRASELSDSPSDTLPSIQGDLKLPGKNCTVCIIFCLTLKMLDIGIQAGYYLSIVSCDIRDANNRSKCSTGLIVGLRAITFRHVVIFWFSTHDIVPRVSNKPVRWNREELQDTGPSLHTFDLRTHDNCSCGEKGDPMHYATKYRFTLFLAFPNSYSAT
ncbi:hypothetical protein AVEN_175548-1 [Araneus ventricosus]|uniref:Uncharacterized protein n=1 Tax=Araneus ventricosus TaxID=182803 RepID=A0A4Y2CMQ3_ARAVE|nr:hypothetical protein AVEN_175548-1 [Araneus ventricosus]